MMNKKTLFWTLAGLLSFLVLWRFGIEKFLDRVELLDRKISAAENLLADLTLLEEEYAESMDDVSGLARVLQERRRDYTPLSFLEKASESAGVKYELIYRAPRPAGDEDEFLEASVRVELYEIDAAGFIEYIYRVENSGEFLRIKNMYIRPRRGLLRASFDVATIVLDRI